MTVDEDADDAQDVAKGQPTPYEELRALNKLGPTQYKWLIKLVQSVARMNGFPPASGYLWHDEAAHDWLVDQLTGTKGLEFFVRVGATATDDVSYTRLARRSIKNAMIDQARGTITGLMRLRLRGILAKEPDFVDFTKAYAGKPAWSLEGISDIWSGDLEDLMHAPELSKIEPIKKLNTAGPTSAENKGKLAQAARVLITRARGALTDQELAKAIVRIFDLDELATYGLRDEDQELVLINPYEQVDEAIDAERKKHADGELREQSALEAAVATESADGGAPYVADWHPEIEELAPKEWVAGLWEVDLLLDGMIWLDRLCVGFGTPPEGAESVELGNGPRVSVTYLKKVIERFNARTIELKVSEEAVKIAIEKCTELLGP